MENLLEEYENLTSEEKNSLLVYKSRLGRAINSLDNDYQEVEDIYYKYKELLSKKKICLCHLQFLKMFLLIV